MLSFIKLVFYEFKKLFSSKIVKLTLLLAFVLNLVLCGVFAYSRKDFTRPTELIEPIYEMANTQPELFQAELARVQSEFRSEAGYVNVYGNDRHDDFWLFTEVNEQKGYVDGYKDRLESVVRSARRIYDANNRLEPEKRDKYTIEYQSEIIALYSGLSESVTLSYENVRGWNWYFEYTYDFVVIVVLLIIVASFIFHEDKNSGFVFLSSATKNGRIKTVAAKITVLFSVCTVSVLLFTLMNFAIVGSVIGFSSGSSLVQTLPDFALVPFEISMGGFAMLNLLFKLFAALFAAIVFALIGVFFGSLMYFLVSALFSLVQVLLCWLTTKVMSQWNYLNVFSISDPLGLPARYRSLNIFGTSVDIQNFIFTFLSAVTVALICLVFVYYSKSKLISFKLKLPKSKLAKFSKHTRRYPTGLLGYEITKSRWVLVFVAAVTLVKGYSSYTYYQPQKSSYERMKLEYIAELEGPYTEEKAAFIENEYNSVAEVNKKFSEIEKAYWAGTVSEAEYVEVYSEYIKANGVFAVLSDLLKYAQHLQRTGNGWFIYDTGIQKYITQPADYLLTVCVACFCGLLYICEFNGKTSQFPVNSIVSTTLNGRKKLFATKLGLGLGVSVLVYLLYFAFDILGLVLNYGIVPLEAPLSSIQNMSKSLWNISFLQYFILAFVFGFWGTVALSVLFVGLSYLFKKFQYIFITVIAGVTVPVILAAVLERGIALAGMANISDGSQIVYICSKAFPQHPILAGLGFLLAYTALAAFTAVIALRKIERFSM